MTDDAASKRYFLGVCDCAVVSAVLVAEGRRRVAEPDHEKPADEQLTPEEEMIGVAAALTRGEVVETGPWILDFIPTPVDGTQHPGIRTRVTIDPDGAVFVTDSLTWDNE